ncbi:MAG: 3-hydroxyacyl-CoA dehydrogenase family protein [Pseudomonadota bacterium]
MKSIRNIAVVGAGLMGHGIAQAFAQRGYPVVLQDLNDDLLARARAGMQANLATLVEMGLEDEATAAQALARVSDTTQLAVAVDGADLVVEAAPEDFELKRALFAQIARHAPFDAILASNTSTLPISGFGEGVPNPGRLVITHWFNPPHIVPVVEVVMGRDTTPQTAQAVCEVLAAIGKRPVRVRQELPGFLVNRIQTAMFREVLSLLAQGVASAEDIDEAVKGSFGIRLSVQGVLQTMDLAGLDLMYKGCGYLFPHLEGATEAPEILREKVARGELGLKTGQGFFRYDPPATGGQSPASKRDKDLLKVLKALAG